MDGSIRAGVAGGERAQLGERFRDGFGRPRRTLGPVSAPALAPQERRLVELVLGELLGELAHRLGIYARGNVAVEGEAALLVAHR